MWARTTCQVGGLRSGASVPLTGLMGRGVHWLVATPGLTLLPPRRAPTPLLQTRLQVQSISQRKGGIFSECVLIPCSLQHCTSEYSMCCTHATIHVQLHAIIHV